VSLVVAPSPRGAHIEVCNTGPGMRNSHLRNIFDRFYRVDGIRRRTDGGGAGLWLSVPLAIVEAHSGTTAAANRPRGGATSTVEIPSHP
jgi:two-component system sensor histidine kinase MtrB